jgi:hypothetical protein
MAFVWVRKTQVMSDSQISATVPVHMCFEGKTKRTDSIMPKRRTGVIPIRPCIVASVTGENVADLALNVWFKGDMRDGAPEERLLTAVQEFGKKTAAKLLAARRRGSKHHSSGAEPASNVRSIVGNIARR